MGLSTYETMTEISLNCLILGTSLEKAFEINICKEKKICHLKESIKEKEKNKFSKIDASDLILWKIDADTSVNVKFEHVKTEEVVKDNLHGRRLVNGIIKIGKEFVDTPLETNVHIIVSSPVTTNNAVFEQDRQSEDQLTSHDTEADPTDVSLHTLFSHRFSEYYIKKDDVMQYIKDFQKKHIFFECRIVDITKKNFTVFLPGDEQMIEKEFKTLTELEKHILNSDGRFGEIKRTTGSPYDNFFIKRELGSVSILRKQYIANSSTP